MLHFLLLATVVSMGVALLGALYLMLWADDLAKSAWVERCFRHAQQAEERAASAEPREGHGAAGKRRARR